MTKTTIQWVNHDRTDLPDSEIVDVEFSSGDKTQSIFIGFLYWNIYHLIYLIIDFLYTIFKTNYQM